KVRNVIHGRPHRAECRPQTRNDTLEIKRRTGMLRSLRLRLGLLLLTGAPLLVLSGCGGNSQVRAAANAPPPMVQVALVERRDVALSSEWIATMDGYINAEIQPHVSGYLIRQNY